MPIDISSLLTTSIEGGSVDLRIRIGDCVNVIGYVERSGMSHDEHDVLLIRAVMYWSAGRISDTAKAAYAQTVRARSAMK